MGFSPATAPVGAGDLARRYDVPIQHRCMGADKIKGAQWQNIGSTKRLLISPGRSSPPVIDRFDGIGISQLPDPRVYSTDQRMRLCV